MVDPIQRTSSVPVLPFQTEQGAQDPLPVNSPREQQRVGDEIREEDRQDEGAAFEDYLNDTSIMTLEKAKKGQNIDTAAEIESASVYSQPGQKTPL